MPTSIISKHDENPDPECLKRNKVVWEIIWRMKNNASWKVHRKQIRNSEWHKDRYAWSTILNHPHFCKDQVVHFACKDLKENESACEINKENAEQETLGDNEIESRQLCPQTMLPQPQSQFEDKVKLIRIKNSMLVYLDMTCFFLKFPYHL